MHHATYTHAYCLKHAFHRLDGHFTGHDIKKIDFENFDF